MKLLITGITGFLGNKLVDLLSKKFEIIGITGQTNKSLADNTINLYDVNSLDRISIRLSADTLNIYSGSDINMDGSMSSLDRSLARQIKDGSDSL